MSSDFMNKQQIIECFSIAEIKAQIEQAKWVFIDLDNTLYQSAQSLGHANWVYEEVDKRRVSGLSREEAFNSIYPIWKLLNRKLSVIPVERELIETLHLLQDRGVTVMGLTHRESFLIPDTLRLTKSLGIDFKKTAPSQEFLEFMDYQRAVYSEGILFVDTFNEKGKILGQFLDRIQKRPEKILFLDDKRKNLEEMKGVCEHRGYEYIGVHYRAIEKSVIYDPELAAIQFKYFAEQILSNEQTLRLLERHSGSIDLVACIDQASSSIPSRFYKIISHADWRKALHRCFVASSAEKSKKMTLLLPEQFEREFTQMKHHSFVALELEASKLIGRLEKSDEEGIFYLLEGSIPLEAVMEVRLHKDTRV